MRPLVAIPTYTLADGRVRGWGRPGHGLPDAYVTALRRAGARPVLLPAPPDGPPDEVLAPFDGLLLAGGGDVDPARYAERRHPAVYGDDPGRDELEVGLLAEAEATGMPVLAVCRGLQVLNVVHGGTLHQHLPDLEGWDADGSPVGGTPHLHRIGLAEGSLAAQAFGATRVTGTSVHHQGIDRLGKDLEPVGWTEDGLVEAVAGTGPGWTLGVQWHPEMTAADDPVQQRVFHAFVAEVAAAGGIG